MTGATTFAVVLGAATTGAALIDGAADTDGSALVEAVTTTVGAAEGFGAAASVTVGARAPDALPRVA